MRLNNFLGGLGDSKPDLIASPPSSFLGLQFLLSSFHPPIVGRYRPVHRFAS